MVLNTLEDGLSDSIHVSLLDYSCYKILKRIDRLPGFKCQLFHVKLYSFRPWKVLCSLKPLHPWTVQSN